MLSEIWIYGEMSERIKNFVMQPLNRTKQLHNESFIIVTCKNENNQTIKRNFSYLQGTNTHNILDY